MIWFRRAIALPLVIAFIFLFIFLLIVSRVNATVGNADFYIDQLRRADIYNFIYDKALPVALEEAESDIDTLAARINISQLKPHVIDVVQQTLPPNWLQLQVENTINAVLPYAVGDTKDFIINIPLKDRVEAAAQAAKDTLHKEDVFPNLYDQTIALVLDKTISNVEELPPPFALSRDDLEPIVRVVLSEEWVLVQLDSAIDEVVPYFTKDKDQFMMRVDISDRLDALEVIAADILKRPETYDYLFEDVVTPTIKQNIEEITRLPMGVALTDDEVLSAVQEVLPLEWYQERVTDIVAEIFSYLRGARETLEVVIPLADRKAMVTSTLSELVHQKLDMSYPEIKELLGIDISIVLAPFVDMWIPDRFVLSTAELRQLLVGEGDEDIFAEAREWVQNDLTYTDIDLRADLGEDYETIENIRKRIAVGFTFTEEELRKLAVGMGGESTEEQWQNFNEIRSWVGTGRRWIMVVWLIPFILLMIIGALCGRNWRSRVIWIASVLALASAMVYVAFGPLFSALAKPRISEAVTPWIDQAYGLEELIANKGAEMAQSAVNSFVSGINIQAIIVLAVSLVAIVLASLWYTFIRRRES